ncbi:hypothetical protein RCO28_37970 [Streptomyces sp. LHD-70]|uniref:hypothetical protein n=1 Tax=Streptomyces sp. LHD-70 TaxID=3072140 RepID=UPI00280CE272|nr:hypothetical protein [Streptomyces sp. LHD-70]MDQ8708206.1 hypothetical protein [Streptomyces sp. LHD-70]
MPYTGYLDLGSTSIIDNELTYALAEQAGLGHILRCPPCPTPDPAWRARKVPDAPWWDDAVPASREFLGLYGLEFTGLTSPTRSRTLTELAHAGATLGRLRASHREIGVRATALATSEAGLSFGLSWLAWALENADTDPTYGTGACGGTAAHLLAYCAADDETAWRTLYDVGLLSFDEDPLIRAGAAGCHTDGARIAEVTFTLVAGRPWLYGPPVTLATQLGFVTETLWPCQGWTAHQVGVPGTPIDCSKTVTDECIQWVPAESGLCTGPAACNRTRSNVLQPDQTTGTGTNTLGWSITGPGTLVVEDGHVVVTGLAAGSRVVYEHPSLGGWPVLAGHDVTFTSEMVTAESPGVPVVTWLDSTGAVVSESTGQAGVVPFTATAPKRAVFMHPSVRFPTAPTGAVRVGQAQLIALAPSPAPGAQCDPDPYQARPRPPVTLPIPVDPSACIATMNPASAVLRVESGGIPERIRITPTIVVTTGAKPLRKLSISIYRSTLGADCNPDTLDECDKVAEFGVPYLGAGTVLTMDGRTGTMSKRCADGSVVDDVPVYNGSGRPLRELPTFSGSEAWCIVALAERGAVTDPMAITATLTILASARLEAS